MNETTRKVLERISVERPYFALEELQEVAGGMVTAVVPPSPTAGNETGPVASAQVARHLAILGSCAAALARDDDARHHYLATKAHFGTLSSAPAAVHEPLRAEAVAAWVNKRAARAFMKLSTESGRGLTILDVEYTVLTPRMFERLNPPINTDVTSLSGLGVLPTPEITETGARMDYGPIPPEMCAGHFPGYPAAPVAIVMGELARTAGAALAGQLGSEAEGYRVEEGHVVASQLARAGQHMVLETNYLKPINGGHALHGTATADGHVFGELTITLSAASITADAVAA